jgi:tetratricopeptide (TPR) repeat protein
VGTRKGRNPPVAYARRMTRANRKAFATALHDGEDLERSQHWEAALETYAGVVKSLEPRSDVESRAMRAIALLRQGNAFMELRKWDAAREAIDAALHEAKAVHDSQGASKSDILAQALLAGGVFAANRKDYERAEVFLLDALERFHRSSDHACLKGRGWTFLNLATVCGMTGRLDLAFVTFTKAQGILGVAEDWAGVAAAWEAQAQLRRAIQDEDRWREDLAEAIVFYDREGMTEKADRLRAMLGKKLV